MAGDKFDQLYNALKADGAVSGTREHFRQFVYAPGKQGYHNRKQLYDALYADGAVSSKSYEEFAQRLGLHAVNPKPQQQKPLTMKQRAHEVAAQYQKPRQQKAQQPSTATTSGTDYMKNWRLMHMRNDQMTPLQQAQASNARERMQRAQEQSARQEQQIATPISRSRITPTAKNFNETMQQLSTPEARQARAKQQREDDARTLAQYEVEGNKFVRNDGKTEGIFGNDLLELVDSSMNEAQELTRQQYQQNLDKMGGIYAPQSVKEQAFRDAQTQEQVNRQNVLMNNLSKKIGEIYSHNGMQRHIAESAEKLNMSVEEYVDKYVTPEIMNYAQKALTMRNQEEIMPHGALDYIAKNLSNSIIGMVVAPSVMSRDTRQRLQEGIAIADGDAEIQKVAGHKDETYRSGIGTRFASTAVNMAADSGPLAVIGDGASAAVNTGTRVLTNGLVRAGVMKAAQKLTAQQMAFKVANMTTAQKIMSGLGTRTATGALNLAGYSGVTAALNQASTGDDTSLQAIGEAGLKGAEHGAVTGAMFGVSGAIMSPWVSKFGITGMEKSTGERLLHGAQKFGATAAGLGVEAGTMMVADNVTGDKDISFGTWLEDVVMVGAFKAGEPSNFVKMGNILHHLTHNSGGNFVIGKNANGSPIAVDIRLTPDEKNELISSASGKNLMDAFVKVDRASKTAPRDPKYKTAYTDFMNDPDVSQSTKEKVNAAMGLFNTTRGKSYRSVNDVKNKQILEYTKNGTLLTRTSYKNADERRAILYKQKLYRDNDDMMSLIGYSKMKDMQLTDEDGNVTSLALGFLRNNGYDTSKDVTDPINAQLINDLRNPKSALYLDWEKYVDVYGSYGYLRSESIGITNNFMASIKELLGKEGSILIDIDKIMRKDPMKRTDQENKIFYYVKSELENRLFPSGKPHADQSASQGKTVAEEHSLGTDNPDSGVVVDELRNLRNAEQSLDAAMDSNDVFKQTFEKLHQQGLTPAQIYDALIQNGLTEEELTPLAQYINANARVQGMQQATADAIDENVKSFISDWSYHGTLNGKQMNGEQALYVKDSSGRTLLVGSGDVAFDQTTGRAKEGSGDMLVCLDPNTKEMVYVKADEVTLVQNQHIDQFAAEYRQRLQMKNSEPYNQAAQEQAMLDAAKPQPNEQEAPKDNTTKSEDNTTNSGDLTKNDTTLTKVDTTSGEDNTTNENLAPQEQPQPTRKFADGTDVPMVTDSKGRPTPDYASMTPEQSAEILTEDFGENAEKVVNGQIQKAEKALKDAEKMKVDYTAEPNDIMEQEALKNQTIEAANKQLDHAHNIKKAMTAKKVAETVGKTEQTEGAHEAGSVAAQKFVNAPRLVGNKRTRMLPDGETKIKGHYEIVPAESLTPSHDVNNDYKKSEGFPTDSDGRTVNDRDYEHDKAAQQNTDQIARKYNGMAIEQVPVVSDEGIVYDGNGRTMAGQKAAKEGTDGEYINDLLENAENFGFTREQIEQSGIEHPRLVMVTDERLPYDAATFAKFNRNEKKTQSNTEQAVAKAKTLTSDEVGAIVAEIEGNGSLEAFFNNSKAINDLVKTLVDKGIIGQNEVAQMMDSPERLSAQGREYVKNLLLGSIFKPETIRMLGIDSMVKNKAINAIRSVMDNMKLGEFSLRDEIDQAIQLLYEARQGGNKVDTLLRTPDMFGEDAAKRYSSISQMMALALEGKVSDFRDLLDEYNRIAKARNTGEGSIFEEAPTKEELIKEFLDFKKWQDYGTGHSEIEGGNDVSGVEEPKQEASEGNEPAEAERPRVEEPEVGTLPLLPKEDNPDPTFDPIAAAAAEFKKEHPLTEYEIKKADVDDLSKDMALDYLNGEVTDDLHRAIYESIYAKRNGLKAEPKVETPKTEPSADPMEGIKNAAEAFEKEKKTKAETEKPQHKADDAAVSASNKKVNDLWKELMNAGKDEMSASFIGLNSKQMEVLPKLVSAMAENAYLRIKRGMHNLEDVVKEMRKEFAPAAKIFKKEDVDAIYEQMMNIRYRDGEQRMSLKDWADYYEKTSPKHQENLVGDSKTAEERKQKENSFINRIQTVLSMGEFKTGIAGMRKIAENCGLEGVKDTDLQELVETAIVGMARRYATSKAMSDDVKFAKIKLLYNRQPSLNQRDSERVMKQQYSTPAPYAFLADMYVKGNGKVIESALEPSAGNGMLTIGLPMDKVHVNDIDAQRLANLRRQGFKNVTSQDGTHPFSDKDVDVVVTNPPFGSATPKEYDGYKISSLEGQMAINALESMKDDGRAAIIIGGKTEYAKNGSLNPKDKAFLGYLYSHYNVEDVINVDGSLYAKQGTSYPTRIILINGRRNYDPEHKVFPPVEKDARAETVKDYDELYKRIEDDILRKRGVQREPLGLSNRERVSDVSGDSLRQKERGGNRVTNNKEHGSGPDGFISDLGTGGSDERPMGETERTPSEHMGDNAELESGRDSDFGADRGTGSASSRLDNGGRVPEGSVDRNANETSNERGAGGDRKQQGGQGRSSSSVQRTVPPREGNGLGVKKEESPKRELSTEKVKYVPQSNNPFSLNSVIPADQARATKKALEKIGDVDSFLVDELGYNDADDMHHALASEQADSVALAIHQAKQGNAFIIGDMTGIGKGRQAAAMIRFAYKQGKIPVFITAKKALFSDMYRDLKSIGNSDLRPFIWAAKDKEHSADMTDSEGKLVYQLPSDKEQERVMDYLQKNGKLPDGYDYIVTTYDSFSSGTMDYEDGKKTVRKNGKGSKNGQRKRDVLEAIAKNANVIMDESHKAGGQGSGSAYLQYVVPKLNAITFLSATYAKRPDNMPIYALRTSMNQAGMKPSELIDAIKRGGATLQEVMSQALTASGQFIRRERDMTGVTIDWKTIDDPVVVEEQREQYDSIIGLFNDIINFQRTYVGAYLDKRNDELAAIQASIQNRQGTKDLGIHNQPFASRTYNMVQQVLLSLKAREAAKSAIDHLKNGEKVVIALNNTNESQTEQYEANAEMEAPDLGVVLMKGLQGVLRYDQTDDMGNKTFGTFNIEDLGPDAVARYHEIEDNIKNASTGLSLSPIDVVRDELEAAGYRVGELTGRKTMFVKNPNGTVSKVKRTDTDKKKLALDFNTNKIDALILNRSASTGISLHDSVEYDVEHKPRTMIVVQQQPDVNEEVQMRGRIDRTGQVNRGRYEYIVSQIPSEQRLLMMFKAKLKSLDANTTSSQKSKFNDMEVSDIINKYGDKVVREYMAEHLDLYSRMADPFGWESSFGEDLSTIDPQRLIVTSGGKLGGKEAGADASKLLGRMALLRVSEQEKMLQEIGELYSNEIQRLNEMGENDLEITELPLKAKTLHKEVWKKGAEPGGDNAFADNTYIEKVNMAILKKPMKASEVKASQEGLTGGKTWDEYKTEKKAAVKEYFDQKITDETQKYEERAVKAATKAKEKYIKDAKKGQKDSGMSDEQIEKMAGYQYENIYKQEKDKLNDVEKNLKAKAEMFERVLDTFDTNGAFVLPMDMNNPNELSGFGNSYGRLIDIKITDNFSPNASSVSFATLDGRRKITFPIAGKVGSGENKLDIIGSIDRMTKQAAGMGDSHLRVLNQNFDNWDRLTSNESRKNGYIVTGNLMQALVDSKDQGLGGQLVKYTTDTGEVKTGILMPDRFDPNGLTTDAPINSVTEKFELSSWHGGIDEVTSSDGEVNVKRIDNNRGNFYELRVPKSKAKGGKYFMDEDLLKLVNGNNFETRGNNMLAEFKPEQLKPVLDRLSKMGVKVQEERKTSEDEGTHFREDRGMQYSKTDTKDVKNSRIIPEDVDKNVSSQIEKRFDDEVERLYGDSSEKPNIEKEANKYAEKQYIDTFEYDKKRNPIQKYEGLKSIIDSLDSKLKDIEQKYGFNRKSDINEIKSAIGTETAEGNDSRGMGGVPQGDSVRISGRKGVLSDYKETALSLAAAQRAKEYLLERYDNIRLKYGLEDGDWASKEQVEKIFNDYNSDADVKKIFDRIAGLVDVLGTKLKCEACTKVNVEGYYYHPKNYILIDTDLLPAIRFGKQELASAICHEMLHVVTSDIINLYRKGYGNLLTESQRQAAKEVVDLYDEIKSYFNKHIGGTEPYALTNPAEMITELANPEWRKIAAQIPAQKGWFRRFFNAIKKMLGLHVDTTTDLDRLDKALENVIRNLDYGVFQKGAELNDEIVNKKASIPVSSHITQLSEKTGGKVKMVSSVDEITNNSAKAAIEEGRKITGWYDEKTGEVHLYMPNIHDRYTAEKTIWHEVVGHKGMRELFGDERFDKFLREVWYDLDKPENAALKKLVDEERKFNPLNIYDAIEEGIARLAEDGKGEPGFWNGIKNKVSDFLHEIGYRIAPNTKDVKYLLWLSKNLQKNPNDPYWKMRAEAVKYRFDHERVPAVVVRNGMYFDNDGKDHDYLLDLNRKDFEEATDGKVHFRTSPMTASKIEEYNRRLGTKLYAFKESTVDHMQSLQEAMEIISGEKHVWTDIPSAFNPLQAQNRIDSIVQQKAEEYDRKYTKPLDDSFKKVVSTMSGSDKDEQLRNAQLYMITKHGLERNRVFFVRDAIRDLMNDDITKAKTLMKDWNDKQKDLADELEKGNIRFDEYLEQMDEWIRSNVDVNFVADEHDYSGFHGMQNIDKTSDPYDDKLAIDNVMSAESQMGSDLAKDFWTKKKAATDYVIDQEYYNGFIDNSDRDYLKGMFQWYVPLRKFDDTTAEDVYGYIGENGDPSNFVGPVLANAKGRSSLSDINVMAQISAMAKSSLINGGKNVVKQHFARFVSAYETGNTKDKIFVEVNPWLEKHVVDGNEVWEESTPQIPENATQQQISNILQNFEDTMQAKKATGDAKLSRRKPNIGFKFQRAKDKSEHIIDVYIAGKKRSFVCQGNPRAAQALNGLVKDSGTRNVATRFDAKITRKIAQFNTSLNPDFMMSNMLRDLTFASANVTKEGFAYTKDFLKEYAGNIISIKNGKGSGNYLTMFRKYRDGKLDINNERERMFKEFMDNGGQTGFVQIKKLESLIDEYDNLIKKGSKDADGWFVKKIKEGGTFIETANEIIENVARYSTYCTSRKHGRSVGRSIYDAKEVSTNFNRHGSGDAIRKLKTSTDSNIDKIFRRSLGFFNSWMKNHTQFYNAGVQGANLFFKNYKSAWKTTAVSFGMLPLGLGIAQALINQFLINNEDEKDRKGVKDPYAELPEWKRRNNICIYTGHGNFKTIPIAIELRAFFGLGDIAAGYVVNDKLKSSTPIGYDILGQMAQLVPASDFLGHHSPSSSIKELGEDALLAVTPTTISPAMELGFNRDWTGRPFYRDYDYLDKAPRWKRAYDNTNDIYMSINKWANQGTNGIDSSNADMKGNETLDYLTAPYAWQHLIDSYTGGMGSTIGRTYKTLEAVGKGVVSGAKSKEGFGKGFSEEFDKFDKNQIPLYRVFNYTPKEGQDMQRTRSKWYNYSDELKQTEYNIKQLKTNTPDVLKNIENNAKKFNFIHGEEGKAYNIWNAADNYIQKKKKILKRVSDPEVIKSINEDINRKMQEAVNDLDKLN